MQVWVNVYNEGGLIDSVAVFASEQESDDAFLNVNGVSVDEFYNNHELYEHEDWSDSGVFCEDFNPNLDEILKQAYTIYTVARALHSDLPAFQDQVMKHIQAISELMGTDYALDILLQEATKWANCETTTASSTKP